MSRINQNPENPAAWTLPGIAALIIIVPVLLPIATGVYNIDPIAFGVIVCINLVLGLLTPPVGAGLFITSAMTNITPGKIFTALFPFLLSAGVVLVLLSWQPQLMLVLLN